MSAPRILVCDDDTVIVELLAEMLKLAGFECIATHSGAEALERTKELLPDLVLLDVKMPDIDGYDVLGDLRNDERTRDIPVILLTGCAEVDDKVRAFDLGVEDYLTKPFDHRELIARISAKLENRRDVEEKIKEHKLRALSTMLDGVAHEVRNPLVVIGGFSKLLMDSLPPDDYRYRYAERIDREVHRLERMVKDITAFQALEVRPVEIVDVAGLVAGVTGTYAAVLADAGIELTLSAGDEGVHIRADREQLSLALSNIVRNAVEAMPQGGRIRVSASHDEEAGSCTIEIADTGAGMSEEQSRLAFDPFYTTKMEGAGLGLTVALRIVKDHGGSLVVRGVPGKGTTAVMTIPLHEGGGKADERDRG